MSLSASQLLDDNTFASDHLLQPGVLFRSAPIPSSMLPHQFLLGSSGCTQPTPSVITGYQSVRMWPIHLRKEWNEAIKMRVAKEQLWVHKENDDWQKVRENKNLLDVHEVSYEEQYSCPDWIGYDVVRGNIFVCVWSGWDGLVQIWNCVQMLVKWM